MSTEGIGPDSPPPLALHLVVEDVLYKTNVAAAFFGHQNLSDLQYRTEARGHGVSMLLWSNNFELSATCLWWWIQPKGCRALPTF